MENWVLFTVIFWGTVSFGLLIYYAYHRALEDARRINNQRVVQVSPMDANFLNF
jgi:hypothetical protein